MPRPAVPSLETEQQAELVHFQNVCQIVGVLTALEQVDAPGNDGRLASSLAFGCDALARGQPPDGGHGR